MLDWQGIVRDHGPAVWRTAHRLLGNRADAEECFQETFVAAVEMTRQKIQPVRQWNALLVRLATARAVDRLRQRVRRTSREVPGGEVESLADQHLISRPHDRVEHTEMSARLRESLAHLPPKQADAFCLHCLEGWSYREIAEHLDESTDNIGVLIHRAREALRERISFITGAGSRNQFASRKDEVTHE